MNKAIRVLVAEDTTITRKILIEVIREYSSEKKIEFRVDSADSYHKALQMLNENEKKQTYYDNFFADIDFSEDNKGGVKDSGYRLIERAFEICPLTHVITYSGQFTQADLWPQYEELKNRGLIAKTMMKSHSEGGEEEWLMKNLDSIFSRNKEDEIMWDIWLNHRRVTEQLTKVSFNADPLEDLNIKNALLFNLDACTELIKQINLINSKETLYKLLVHLYHSTLEQFCRGGKTDLQIIVDSDNNKIGISELINYKLNLQPTKSEYESSGYHPNSQRILCSYCADERIKFSLQLNQFRNNAIHSPADKSRTGFNHVIYANLVLTLFAAGKGGTNYNSVFNGLSTGSLSGSGEKQLKELIKFIGG